MIDGVSSTDGGGAGLSKKLAATRYLGLRIAEKATARLCGKV